MLLPAIGFVAFLIVCAVLSVVGIFVLTYIQSNFDLGNNRWSLVFFVVGTLAAGVGAATAYLLIGGYFSGVVFKVHDFVGPNLIAAGIILPFLLMVPVVGIVGGVFAVWLGDRFIPRRESM